MENRKLWRKDSVIVILLLLTMLTCFVNCRGKNNSSESSLVATVLKIDDFGGAVLNLSPDDMANAGFDFGDVLQVEFNDTVVCVPYFDGYYAKTGDLQLTSYQSTEDIEFTSQSCGLSPDLKVGVGTEVCITMHQKAGAIALQDAMSMRYSDDIADYGNDTVKFANVRVVQLGRMASNRLYRSASPFDNSHNRAAYVSAYMQNLGVACVLDLADNEDKVQSLLPELPAYSNQLVEEGKVVFCKLNANYRSDETNVKMLRGFMSMVEKPGPYLIHCLEGKDRTGYACAILEALCGATYDEIVNDYLITYDNYFGINPQNKPDVCKLILALRLNDALMFFCGVQDAASLRTIDLETAIRQFMRKNGLTDAEIDCLQNALCESR
ncbi:MAG: tyrosine-protein phosphatase [Bacteroidales bacterium]|nr:tyrosine-protein phosphatase [Bacteroidales bacterium]